MRSGTCSLATTGAIPVVAGLTAVTVGVMLGEVGVCVSPGVATGVGTAGASTVLSASWTSWPPLLAAIGMATSITGTLSTLTGTNRTPGS